MVDKALESCSFIAALVTAIDGTGAVNEARELVQVGALMSEAVSSTQHLSQEYPRVTVSTRSQLPTTLDQTPSG